jgi:hypothetical protein
VGILGWSLDSLWEIFMGCPTITQKEKLVRLPIFIVDAINNGHGN